MDHLRLLSCKLIVGCFLLVLQFDSVIKSIRFSTVETINLLIYHNSIPFTTRNSGFYIGSSPVSDF